MFPTLVITMSNKYESFRMSHKHVPAYFPGYRVAMFPILSQIQFFSLSKNEMSHQLTLRLLIAD